MKKPYLIAAIGCVCILALVLIAGCTGNSESAVTTGPTIVPPGMATSQDSVSSPTAVSTAITGATKNSNASVATYRTVYVNSTANGQIVSVPMGDRVLVRLTENPTTGYTWNATASKGLDIISDKYVAPDATLMGAPGHHDWLLSPQTVDTYTFKAVNFRSWEGVKAADETFSTVILVTKS